MKKIIKILSIIFVAYFIILYLFTPFAKKQIAYDDYYIDPFFVYYISGYLFNYDAGYFGKQSQFPLVKIIFKANRWSFNKVGCSGNIAKDKNNIYFLGTYQNSKGYTKRRLDVIQNVDSSSFRMATTECSLFFFDKKNVYYATPGASDFIKFENSDPNTFVQLDSYDGNGIDKNYYYCDRKQYKLTENFKLLYDGKEFGSNEYIYLKNKETVVFAKDNNSVYYIGDSNVGGLDKKIECFVKLEDADVNTFVTDVGGGIKARDKFSRYEYYKKKLNQ